MAWSVNFQVTRRDWLRDPKLRWNAGLQYAGLNFRQSLGRSHYPPVPPTPYIRTYQLADRANFRIVEMGAVMEFGSTFYLPYVLQGTEKWQGWSGFLPDMTNSMRDGFAYGIRNY